MLSAYMGDMKGDANGFYFPYAATMAPNMVPQNFPAYGVPLSTYESNKDENYPTTAQQQQPSQQQHQHQHKASTTPEDEESKKKRMSSGHLTDGNNRNAYAKTVPAKKRSTRDQRKQREKQHADTYRERRDKNNLAAKKSRSNRREREKMMQQKVDELEKENEALRAQLALYTQQLEYAKKEYERQMSLSYAAQPQGMILRETTNTLMATPQPSFFYSTQFAQQPNIT